MNIWRKEHEKGIEIRMPHRPMVDDEGNFVLNDDGQQLYETCRVRSLTLSYILKGGRMPNSLVSMMDKVLVVLGLSDELDAETDTSSDKDSIAAISEYQQFVITEMLVYPKIVTVPKKDDEISYNMLSTDDIIFFMNDVLDRPIANLRPFPRTAAPSLAVVPKSQEHEVSADPEPAH